MDNRDFNVKGKTKEQLAATLRCLLLDEYGMVGTAKMWYVDIEKGLVFVWINKDGEGEPFRDKLGRPKEEVGCDELVEIAWDWLQSDEAKTIKLTQWDKDADHDGENHIGFRVYLDQWGQVYKNGRLNNYSICAITPAFCWYGK